MIQNLQKSNYWLTNLRLCGKGEYFRCDIYVNGKHHATMNIDRRKIAPDTTVLFISKVITITFEDRYTDHYHSHPNQAFSLINIIDSLITRCFPEIIDLGKVDSIETGEYISSLFNKKYSFEKMAGCGGVDVEGKPCSTPEERLNKEEIIELSETSGFIWNYLKYHNKDV